jgi:hypothetical protein
VDHIRLHCLDALEYPIPPEPCVLYVYHAFGEPVLARVLDNVEASLRDNPRPIYFVYLNPKLRHIFERRPSFQEMQRPWLDRLLDRLISPEVLAIYRTRS